MSRMPTSIVGLALGCAGLAVFCGSGPAMAASMPAGLDYGPLKDDLYSFWTRVGKDGTTAWRKAAAAALHDRGFSDAQIAKVTPLKLVPARGGFPGDYTLGKAGIAKLTSNSLPLRFNSETGAGLPMDPKAYAAALPGCYAQDERACAFRFSTQEGITGDGSGDEGPCLLPPRTAQFCRTRGFVNRNTFNMPGKPRTKDYSPSCGEQDRINGCGADEVVFDDGDAQTKLAFAVDGADKPASAAPPTPAPAAPSFPRIVYHVDKDAAFSRREGPPTMEEWEPDLTLFKRLRQAERKQARDLPALPADFDRKKVKWTAYCWPHDVYKPCDIE